jgi:L-asparaginase II
MTDNAEMVAGSGRLDSEVIAATAGRVLVKVGAEGVYAGAVPAAGLGLALKIDDGARRAAEVACVNLLDRLGVLDGPPRGVLAGRLQPGVHTRAGAEVGEVRAVL